MNGQPVVLDADRQTVKRLHILDVVAFTNVPGGWWPATIHQMDLGGLRFSVQVITG